MISIYLLVGLLGTLSAQITIDNTVLPDIGDELVYANFNNYPDTSYRVNGEGIDWVFENFAIRDSFTESYRAISTDTTLANTYPEANMIVDDGGPLAAIRTENNIEIIGTNDLEFPGAETLELSYNFRSTPINYNDTIVRAIRIPFTISADLIPGLDSMEVLPGATIDSIRLTLNNVITDRVTAWGNLNLNGEDHEVLKIEREDSTSTQIEIAINLFGTVSWIDATSLIGEAAGDFGDFGFGNGSSLSYIFMGNETKYHLVEFEETELLDTSDLVIGLDISGSIGIVRQDITQVLETHTLQLQLYPNPASDFIRLQGPEGYERADLIQIIGIDGRVYHQLNNHILDDDINVRQLDKGHYFITSYYGQHKYCSPFIVIR